MRRIIQDIWYGHIAPIRKCGDNDENIENLTKFLEKNKAALGVLMNEQQKERFEKYTDCVEEYIALIAEQAFCEGGQFTAHFLTEALC